MSLHSNSNPSVTFVLLKLCCFSAFISFAVTQFTLPTDPNLVSFWLYPNAANTDDADELVYLNASQIRSTRYNPNLNCIFYATGFMENRTSDQAIKNAYLKKGFATTSNIIVVDWSQLNGNRAPPLDFGGIIPTNLSIYLQLLPLYIDSASNVFVTAGRVQQFLTFLNNNSLLLAGPQNVHMVGQSLGAHVQGVAARGFTNQTGLWIGRLTGTEPAGPLFQNGIIHTGFQQTDATFVDVVHTNGGEAGYLGNLGDVDFYLNGGSPITPNVQEECLALANLTNIFCSHNLAVAFYAESIRNLPGLPKGCSLPITLDSDDNYCCLVEVELLGAVICIEGGNTVQFGEYCPTSATGTFYLNITTSS